MTSQNLKKASSFAASFLPWTPLGHKIWPKPKRGRECDKGAVKMKDWLLNLRKEVTFLCLLQIKVKYTKPSSGVNPRLWDGWRPWRRSDDRRQIRLRREQHVLALLWS